MFSTKQTAVHLNCTKRNVIYLVSKGQLTPVNPQKEFFLFDENEVLILKNTRNGK